MSRIGRQPITIPAGVKVNFADGAVTVEGPLGKLTQVISSRNLNIKVDGATLTVERSAEDKSTRSKHGLYRALIANMVKGVVTPFVKTLIVHGVGYKCSVAGNKLTMNIGFSHPVEIFAPEGIKITCTTPTEIKVEGISKELVGHVAAEIKAKKPVEPYHLYGIRYNYEKLTRKEGKTAGK